LLLKDIVLLIALILNQFFNFSLLKKCHQLKSAHLLEMDFYRFEVTYPNSFVRTTKLKPSIENFIKVRLPH